MEKTALGIYQSSKCPFKLNINLTCRNGLNNLFELENPLMEYIPDKEVKTCSDLDCEETQICLCSFCSCCSVCVTKCQCSMATIDPNEKLAEMLGFGDDSYR